MNRQYFVIALLFAVISSQNVNANAIRGEAIVQMKNATSAATAESQLPNAFVLARDVSAPNGIFVVSYDTTLSTDSMIALLKSDNDIELAQGNYAVELYAVFPDEFSFNTQWALYDADGRNDIHAPEAWEITTGNGRNLYGDTAIVGFLDTGANIGWLPGACQETELQGNHWANHVEYFDGLFSFDSDDTDDNGYWEDWWGYDAPEEQGLYACTTPGFAHATYMESVAGAIGNNSSHMSGVFSVSAFGTKGSVLLRCSLGV